MAINPIAINAYRTALGQSQSLENKVAESLAKSEKPKTSFVQTLEKSVADVNHEQIKKIA